MRKAKNNLTTLDQYIGKHFGKRGTAKREKFESDYEMFKISMLLYKTQGTKGLTKEELVSKIESKCLYIKNLK